MPIFALVDCNNFFASCERVFRPDLEGKAIAVLSNNDGCVIARSEEAKQAGLPMCAPIFKYKDLIYQHNIQLFSGNFSLYGDISRRVMQTLETFTERMEMYSIDEAFLSLEHIKDQHISTYARSIQQTVKQWVGIPVSIGVAPTKTLAKLANEISKKHTTYSGIFNFFDYPTIDQFLERTDICDLWGIGRKLAKVLYSNGIYTALQLKNTSDIWMKKKVGIVGQRLVWELRGISCLPLEDIKESKKGILSSRSFSKPVTSRAELKEAVAAYTSQAAEKLRQEKSLASCINVWIVTNRFKPEDNQYANSYSLGVPEPTAYTPLLISYAWRCLDTIFAQGFKYKKAAVMLTGIIPQNQRQLHMFAPEKHTDKHTNLMQALDSVNKKHGRVMYIAAEGMKKNWYMKSSHQSPLYTTSWKSIPIVAA